MYKKGSFKTLCIHKNLENSDKSKYESILKNLNQQNSFGNNQYPKSITEANSILNNHKYDGSYIKSRNIQKSQKPKNDEEIQENGQPISLTFTQIEVKCYCCGKSCHKSPQCKFKNKLKREWFINNVKVIQRGQEFSNKGNNDTKETVKTSTYSGNSTITSKSNPKQIGWTNLHYALIMNNNQRL